MSGLLGTHDAVELARMVRDGEVTAAELTEEAIARIDSTDGEYNAIIHRLDDKARAQAAAPIPDGPFAGVPIVIKDLYAPTAGDPLHNGVQGFKNDGYVHPVDGDLIALYRKAGFIFVGRSNTPELGLVGTTEPSAYGPSRNPWNVDYGVGGSSGGSAGAVAAGMVPVGHASDGGGSIRIPAAMCGLVGLKPSRGRVPMGPLGEEWGLSVQHAVTRSVRDSAAMLDVSCVHTPGDGVIAPGPVRPYADEVGADPGRLRIAMLAHSLREDVALDPEIAAATRAVANQLEALGHDVFEAYPPALDDHDLVKNFLAVWTVGAAYNLERLGHLLGRQLTEDDVEPGTWIMAEVGRKMSGLDVMSATGSQAAFRRLVGNWWADNCDLMLTPTTALAAPRIGDLVGTKEHPNQASLGSIPYATYTSPFNVTGQPAISLPMAMTTSGLPIGIQLAAAYGREDQLIQVASQLEDHFIPVAPATG